jgi:hypothetical protein
MRLWIILIFPVMSRAALTATSCQFLVATGPPLKLGQYILDKARGTDPSESLEGVT